MIDTRAVGQELQEQLAIVARKGQEQVRRGQEQVRKGQETVTEVVRVVAAAAEAFRPQLPAIKLPSLPASTLPGSSRLPSASDVIVAAQQVAEQVLAVQRKFAEQVMQATGPLLAQGAAQLSRAAQTAGITTPTARTIRTVDDAEHIEPEIFPELHSPELHSPELHSPELHSTPGTQRVSSDSTADPATDSGPGNDAGRATPTTGGRMGTGFRQTVPRRSRPETDPAEAPVSSTSSGGRAASGGSATSKPRGTGKTTAGASEGGSKSSRTGASTGKAATPSKGSGTGQASGEGTSKISGAGAGQASGSRSKARAAKTGTEKAGRRKNAASGQKPDTTSE